MSLLRKPTDSPIRLARGLVLQTRPERVALANKLLEARTWLKARVRAARVEARSSSAVALRAGAALPIVRPVAALAIGELGGGRRSLH